jgi:cell division protein FtsQ
MDMPSAPFVAPERLRTAGAVMLSLFALAVALWMAAQQTARPVAHLSVSGGGQRVTAADIRLALSEDLQGPISRLNLGALQHQVLALPWVARARVERVWPDGVHVRVWERVPMARWGSGALLDTTAATFSPRPSEVPPGLPQLDGPSGAEAEVMQRYLGLAEAVAEAGLELSGLSLDVRGEWVGRVAPGVPVRFGRVDPLSRVAVLNGPVARVTTGRLSEVERIDLRYTNGFAVRWRTSAADQGAQ